MMASLLLTEHRPVIVRCREQSGWFLTQPAHTNGFFSSPADCAVLDEGDTAVWISKCEQLGSTAEGWSLRTVGKQNQTTV